MTVIAHESLLSPQWIAVRDAIGPVVRRFRARTDAVPRQTDPVHDMFDFISDHLGALDDWTGHVTDEINEGLGRVASDPEATEEEVRLAVSGLERRLRRLLDDFDHVRSVNPDRSQKRGWELLVRLYLDIVDQVQAWLDELIACLNNPRAAAEKRGVAGRKTAEIRLALVLEPPAETRALMRWAEGSRRARSAQAAEGRTRWRPLLAWVLVVLGLAWLLGGDHA